MILRTVSFGSSGHARQTHLPGTDPALLPDPAGLYAPPRPDALSSQPFTPRGDGTEALFDGRVTATTTGHGTAAERTVFDVSGPWNSVKNAAAQADGAADLAFSGFVHVDAAVGLSSDGGSTIEIVGAKRGNLATGDDADRIDVHAASNVRHWSNEFRIASGAGDDEVRLSPLDAEGAARAGDATFAATEEASRLGGAPRPDYDGSDTAASVELGAGDDLLAVEGRIRAEARWRQRRPHLVGRRREHPRGRRGRRHPVRRATDGTAAGTALVTYVEPGTGRGVLRGLSALGDGRAVFAANDGVHGFELWISDGTAAGTTMVKDIVPGPHSMETRPSPSCRSWADRPAPTPSADNPPGRRPRPDGTRPRAATRPGGGRPPPRRGAHPPAAPRTSARSKRKSMLQNSQVMVMAPSSCAMWSRSPPPKPDSTPASRAREQRHP